MICIDMDGVLADFDPEMGLEEYARHLLISP